MSRKSSKAAAKKGSKSASKRKSVSRKSSKSASRRKSAAKRKSVSRKSSKSASRRKSASRKSSNSTDTQLFERAYVWMLYADSKHGEKVLSGGKECTVSNMEGKEYWWFAEAHKNGEEIEFFPNRPEESFKLIPKDFDLLLVHSKGAPEKARLSVDITRDPGKGDSISYDLDIRNAVAEQTNK